MSEPGGQSAARGKQVFSLFEKYFTPDKLTKPSSWRALIRVFNTVDPSLGETVVCRLLADMAAGKTVQIGKLNVLDVVSYIVEEKQVPCPAPMPEGSALASLLDSCGCESPTPAQVSYCQRNNFWNVLSGFVGACLSALPEDLHAFAAHHFKLPEADLWQPAPAAAAAEDEASEVVDDVPGLEEIPKLETVPATELPPAPSPREPDFKSDTSDLGPVRVAVVNMMTATQVCGRVRLPRGATGRDFRRAISRKTKTPSLLYDLIIGSEVVGDADTMDRFIDAGSTEQDLTIQVVVKDQEEFLEGVRTLRKRLSRTDDPQIDEAIADGAVPLHVRYLQEDDFPMLQFESAWILTNITSGSFEHTRAVVDEGAIPIFVSLLGHKDFDVRDQSIWALGNISGEGAELRNRVLEAGGLERLVANLQKGEKLTGNFAWCLSNLCRGRPRPPVALVQPLVDSLLLCITKAQENSSDREAITNMLWATHFLCDSGNDDRVHAVVSTGVVPVLVPMLDAEAPISKVALTALGNVAAGSDKDTQVLLDSGFLGHVHALMQRPDRQVRKEVCLALSNIMAGPLSQVRQVLDCRPCLLRELVRLSSSDENRVKKEAWHALSNPFSTVRNLHDKDVFARLLAVGCLDAFLGCIRSASGDEAPAPELRVVEVVVSALSEIATYLKAEVQAVTAAAADPDTAEGYMQIIRECLQDFVHDNTDLMDSKEEILAKLLPDGEDAESKAAAEAGAAT
eukprot:TRINITY_DN7031_c0_g1_i4.p1 TRINITY_DN7031_c0_g1~~TRINITY_DN7031_c0_g1_i4.p1  ORF type:complete len:738 (-),score=111.07 TRINITY_DN7031_c0_g1_i4:76-2289(-)